MKVCQNCHLEFDDKYVFCHKCGGKLVTIAERTFCPYCGKEMENEGEFCPYCGNRITVVADITSKSLLNADDELEEGIDIQEYSDEDEDEDWDEDEGEYDKRYEEAYSHFKNAVKLGNKEAIIWLLSSPIYDWNEHKEYKELLDYICYNKICKM